jgi:hypothetical protein
MATTQQISFIKGRRNAAAWIGLVTGPAAWFLDEQFSYGLTRYACYSGHMWVLHLISACALALVIFGAWMAWRAQSDLPHTDEHAGHVLDAAHWLCWCAIAFNAAFAVVIIASAVPRWMISPCANT